MTWKRKGEKHVKQRGVGKKMKTREKEKGEGDGGEEDCLVGWLVS